jgi:hypothetical protein
VHPFDAYCRFPLFLTLLPLRTSRHPQVFHTSNPSRSSTWILQYRHLPPNSFIAIKSNKSSSEPSSSLSNRLIVRRVSSLSIVCRRLSSSVVVSSFVVSSVVVCRRRWSLVVGRCLSSPQFSAAYLKVEKLRPLKSGAAPALCRARPCSYPCSPTPCRHQIHQHSKFPAARQSPGLDCWLRLPRPAILSPIIQFIHHHHHR